MIFQSHLNTKEAFKKNMLEAIEKKLKSKLASLVLNLFAGIGALRLTFHQQHTKERSSRGNSGVSYPRYY